MKIILSPTKTQEIRRSNYLEDKELLYPHKTAILLRKLKNISKKKMKSLFKISDDLFEETYFLVENHDELPQFHAFEGFNGLVFKGLDKANYHEKEYQYIKEYVTILDAFYGVLEPGTLVRRYRLDFKVNIGLSLYRFWNIASYYKDEMIINLASKEYAKMLEGVPMINIEFLQEKKGELKNVATYAKQGRGIFLNYLIKNQITDIKQMKQFNLKGYSYNMEASSDENIIFSRVI